MKNESKHTPGPWNFSKDGAEIFPETGPNGYVELCRVVGPWDGSSYYDEETAKSNARLIAAAPELLDSVKFALTLAREDLAQAVAEGALEDGMHMAAVRRIVESFENVISKAEGA